MHGIPTNSKIQSPRHWALTPRLDKYGEEIVQDTLLYSRPQLISAAPVTVPKAPSPGCLAEAAISDELFSQKVGRSLDQNADIGRTLRRHKEEVIRELKELLLRHETSLERKLADFRVSLDSPESRHCKQVPTSECNFGEVPSVTSQQGSQRRTGISSKASEENTYISMQDMRNQCLAKAHSKLHFKSGSGSSFASFEGSFSFGIISKLSSKARTLSNSFFFELFFASLICVNSVLLGVEVAVVSSSPKQDVPHFFYYSTMGFSVAFLTELCIRLLGEGGVASFLFYSELRAWNWFDLVVVICSLVEVGFNFVLLGGGSQSVTRIMRMARMTRLGRVLRVFRIVRFASQLRVLVISIMSTLQTLLWAMFLLLIIIYVFAVLLAQATAEHFAEDRFYDRSHLISEGDRLEHYWGSLEAAMYTLFMSIAGGVSWEAAVFAIAEVHWLWGALFTCFIAFSSFALINVMTAVFCQSAIETAQKSMDVKWQSMCADKQRHIKNLKRLFQSMDSKGRGTVNMRKLVNCWGDEEIQAFLHSMELAPDDCWTFFTILDKQDKEVNAADFVDGCLRLKGQAKAFDMAVLTYELRHLSKQNVSFMNQMQARMNSVLEALGGAADSSDHSNGVRLDTSNH